ncbi:MAG: amidohydrolase family protein [Armatimonadota bacterium]|nr:MAG: amidohydrolase family protein [Armatimonadota bacterium]
MRIDAHVHGDIAKLEGTPDEYAARCRGLGIERIGLIEDLEDVMAAYRLLPDFVIPIARVDIDAVSVEEIHDCFTAGAAAIKFINPRFSYGDTRYDPLYAAISEREKVAVFHTGYLGRGKLEQPQHTDFALMRPAAIDCLSRRHPDLKIVMAHYGNPWWEEAWKVTWSVPNVYADMGGGTAFQRSLLMWREMLAPNGELDEEGVRKLMFATDVGYFSGDPEVGPYLNFYDKLLDAIGAPEELRERVNRGNAIALFGLE